MIVMAIGMESSSLSALLDVSSLALFSETRLAAVYCAIINPELSPPSLTRNGGSPRDLSFETRRKKRRSLIAASSAIPMAR
jgi:hypothetical protein